MMLTKLLVIVAVSLSMVSVANAQVKKANEVQVTNMSAASYTAESGLFTYSYTFSNGGSAALEVSEIHIPLRGATVLNIQSPPGWLAILSDDGQTLQWCACAEDGFVASPGYVDDGKGLPSTYQIKPGQSRSGFSFQSAFPGAQGPFYAGGFVTVPVEGVDFLEGQEPATPDHPLHLALGTLANAPMFNPSLEFGGRRPSVDGYAVFTTIKDGGAYSAPLLLDVKFGQQGEIVDQATFKATLNGIDITREFVAIAPNQIRARLPIGAALKSGKNVLVTAVQGKVPGATRTTKDTDRLTFLIQ